MGCGASTKYIDAADRTVDKLVASTAPPQATLFDIDAELVDKLWLYHDKGQEGKILASAMPALLKKYAQAKKEKIEHSMNRRISDEQMKASLLMKELEERHQELSDKMLADIGVAADGEVAQHDFDVEFTKLMEELTGDANPQHGAGRRFSKQRVGSKQQKEGVFAQQSSQGSKKGGTFRSGFIDEFLLMQLWDQYDTNQDQVLQADEATALLEAYSSKYVEKLEKAAITKRGTMVMSHGDKEMLAAMQHLKANSGKYAKMLLDLMDVDRNGDVEKDEFLEKFPNVWEQINFACKRASSEKHMDKSVSKTSSIDVVETQSSKEKVTKQSSKEKVVQS